MVDYSKWKNIEVSDDEDETHPNVDTPSLFRWRHQARIERMAEKEKEKQEIERQKKQYDEKLKAAKKVLQESEKCSDEATKEKLKKNAQKQMKDLESELKKVNMKTKEFEKKEKLEAWNVDTISNDGFSKSLINKDIKPSYNDLSEDEKTEQMKIFVKENSAKIKQFGLFKNYDDSRKFMQENLHLACEYSANYLVLWCIDLELEDKNTLMRHVAHQTVCLQFILELAKQLDRDPRSCVSAFFHRIQVAEADYQKAFDDELMAFIGRIEKRAKEKIAEAQKEAEEEERQQRLGPGGLDPLEVIETLPEELKACFESQDVQQLKDVISNMDSKLAAYHMKRCVDSGLWVPEGGSSTSTTDPKTGLEKKEEEEIYEEVD